jgi:hypothetical protein
MANLFKLSRTVQQWWTRHILLHTNSPCSPMHKLQVCGTMNQYKWITYLIP